MPLERDDHSLRSWRQAKDQPTTDDDTLYDPVVRANMTIREAKWKQEAEKRTTPITFVPGGNVMGWITDEGIEPAVNVATPTTFEPEWDVLRTVATTHLRFDRDGSVAISTVQEIYADLLDQLAAAGKVVVDRADWETLLRRYRNTQQ